MPLGLWFLIGWMAFVVLTAIIFLIYGFITGQFKDVEEAKYRMLEEREPEGWPGSKEDKHD
jgi:nitrogen fixation-related uncharacterized protein